jgi:hypothetical protein
VWVFNTITVYYEEGRTLDKHQDDRLLLQLSVTLAQAGIFHANQCTVLELSAVTCSSLNMIIILIFDT